MIVSLRHLLLIAHKVLSHNSDLQHFVKNFHKYSSFDENFLESYIIKQKSTYFVLLTVDNSAVSLNNWRSLR